MKQTVDKRRRRGWKILLLVLGILLTVMALTHVLLVVVNDYTLTLSLTGEEDIRISVGEDLQEPSWETHVFGSLFLRDGFFVDAQITVDGKADPSVPGTYTITYTASWHGLVDSQTRTVTVQDVIPPVITLVYVPGACTLPGEEYKEEGYSAWDDCDGDITDRVVCQMGDGIMTYTVSDQAGNQASVTREICDQDSIGPELILTGGDTVYIYAGETYADPGWSAVDNHDGDLSSRVEVTEAAMDKYLAGSYEFVYTVSDDSGNISEATRTVVVQPRERPETVIPEGNVIYLTFDDGPSEYTKRLLDILDKYDAKATFFVINSQYVDLVKDIVDRGHAIGIHSVTHDYKKIYDSVDAYFNDILTMQQIIYDLTGVRTYLMRFPGGSSNTASIVSPGIMTYLTEAVEDNGFCYFDWDVDSWDAGGAMTSKEVFQNVKNGVYGRQISIVLQHDTTAYSVSAVEKILIWGIQNGYRFLALDMTSPTVHHDVKN